MNSDRGAAAFPGLTRLAWVTVGVLYVLVVIGGIVTSSDSGMGCGAHWPICAGHVLPPANLHSIVEWTHRLVAGIASVLIVVLAVLVWIADRRSSSPRRLSRSAGILVAILALQVVLGALVVLNGIPPWLIALHEGAALLLLDGSLALALTLSVRGTKTASSHAKMPPVLTGSLWLLAGWAGLTSMFGSYLAHLNGTCSGLGVCVGTLAHEGGSVGAGLWHWTAAILLGLAVLGVWSTRRTLALPVRRWLGWSAGLMGAQAVIGVVLLASGLSPVLLSVHEAVSMALGAALAGTAVMGSLVPAASPHPLPKASAIWDKR